MTALIADDFRENLIIDRLCRAVGLQFGLQTPYRTSVRLQPPRGPTHWAKTAHRRPKVAIASAGLRLIVTGNRLRLWISGGPY